ncbi:hypothetical protein K501DRAFT_274590 [Backusella circina FSU 941]|nr:hypothetical protein K501DRAFT_274590 [Backusella circina FSU 941]
MISSLALSQLSVSIKPRYLGIFQYLKSNSNAQYDEFPDIYKKKVSLALLLWFIVTGSSMTYLLHLFTNQRYWSTVYFIPQTLYSIVSILPRPNDNSITLREAVSTSPTYLQCEMDGSNVIKTSTLRKVVFTSPIVTTVWDG